MPVISASHEFEVSDLFVNLQPIFGHRLFVKVEGFNFAGSIKLKAAREMVAQAEASGALRPGSTLVESSSGNMGVALSVLAAARGYRFICVTDSRCNEVTRRTMESYGTEVHLITEPHETEGFLGARIRHVQALLAADERRVWLNQYLSPGNWMAHYRTTAPAIARQFPDLNVLFVGAGTTGTLMGCARYFRERRPSVRVIPVDSVGSVTFGTPPATRHIPGLGTSVRPPLLDDSLVDRPIHVEERDTVRTCRELMRGGFMFGGSTGTAVSGALRWLNEHHGDGAGGVRERVTAVTISPDLGERYLDTVYHDEWVRDAIGPEGLLPGIEHQGLDASPLAGLHPVTG
ncbi:2,3-diaminopropionate biosynthesis protein SbnA [Kitasatospora sp. SUK 42]|uniref:2,3-diaminopropionate biosynthesis protein SbnA n=1 Tax=Kitasatospora sp. SUK 42 TaxID=1588882 RepID=UPI0018C9B73A|nr:2,3-diaminopropionate biosynthesis protein SbnA [Kitasatospora sp. SUK 42]MBV2154731.1 2,3-diaminopropionate biosynthesis protein SbnA [Kitasatospora sp. SUK 42]